MSQQYSYPYPPSSGEGYPQAPSGVQDPYATQGNYGYPAAPNPAAPNPDYGAPLIPGFGAPPAVSAEYPTQAPAYGRADPSYGGAAVTYDAVNYPSIPDLIAHSQRHSSVSAPPSSGYGYGGATAGGGTAGGSSNARVGGKPREMAGAPRGSNRYRCMLFPTCDGGDIESVVCQVGLDGIALFEEDGDRVGERVDGHGYELDKISSWRLADPTILTVKVAGRDGVSALTLSADEATCGAMMDTLVTSAFQWCELRGHDASGTIEDKNGEWFNNKALASAGGSSAMNASSSVPSAAAAAAAAATIAWHDRPEYCGWLTKKGEHLSNWRRRWFVLKDKKLGWFKDVSQANRPGTKPRGVIDLSKVISACTATLGDAGRAHGVELIGSVEAEKAGCKFLCADSERECDGWAAKLAEVCNDSGGGGGGGDSAPSGASPHPTHSAPTSRLASQLDQGYQSSVANAAASSATSRGRPFDPDINVSVTDYASGAGGGATTTPSFASDPYLQLGGGNANGAWDTYYTNEGVAYYVNSQTGVTQWEKPNP